MGTNQKSCIRYVDRLQNIKTKTLRRFGWITKYKIAFIEEVKNIQRFKESD